MSHFSQIKTKISDKRYLMQVLRELGFEPEEGQDIRGYGGSRSNVEIRIRSRACGYNVGFRKRGKQYVCVADWFGVTGIEREPFLKTLTQRYASIAVKDQLAGQGFSVAEEKHVEGRLHLVLRRLGQPGP